MYVTLCTFAEQSFLAAKQTIKCLNIHYLESWDHIEVGICAQSLSYILV